MLPENANRWRTIMDVKDFYYDLPQELIAQDPLEGSFQLQTDGFR